MLLHPPRVLRARSQSTLGRLLHVLELRRGRDLPERRDRVPIFVLGAPRSGTTLLMQVLVEAFDVGWLANAHASWPGGVSFVERRQRPRAARTGSSWQSTHGATREPWEPTELGEFWYRFVPREPHELAPEQVTPRRAGAVRAAIRAFADACERPVVFKNVFNTLRVPLLAAALPEARFVLIERDLEANARSVLAARASRGGVERWWSARPAGWQQLDAAGPARQVAWQVSRINEVARRDLRQLGDQRVLVLSYAELCSRPAAVVDRLEQWLEAGGARVERRPDADIPPRFELRRGGELDPALEAELRDALDALKAARTGREERDDDGAEH